MFRFNYLLFGGILFSLYMWTSVQTSEAGEKKYTLPQLVQMAVQNTQILSSQEARVEEQRYAAQQSRQWPGGTFDFSLGRREEGDQRGPRYEVGVSQPLPLFGKLSLPSQLFDLEAESWRAKRVASRANIMLQVANLAYDYTNQQRKLKFIEKRQKRFELIHSYLTGRIFPTPQRKAESRIVQNHLTDLVVKGIQSQSAFAASFESLKMYVASGSMVNPDIETTWFLGAKTLDEKQWMRNALENNADLLLQQFSVKRASLEKSLNQKNKLPAPSLLASYERSKADVGEENFGVGLSLAFYSWNRNRYGARSAELKQIAEQQLLAFEEQKLRATLARNFVEYEAARQIIQKYPETLLTELDEQLQEAEHGFRKGQIDLLTFLELDNSASETFDHVIEAQERFLSKVMEILALSGEQEPLVQLASF